MSLLNLDLDPETGADWKCRLRNTVVSLCDWLIFTKTYWNICTWENSWPRLLSSSSASTSQSTISCTPIHSHAQQGTTTVSQISINQSNLSFTSINGISKANNQFLICLIDTVASSKTRNSGSDGKPGKYVQQSFLDRNLLLLENDIMLCVLMSRRKSLPGIFLYQTVKK